MPHIPEDELHAYLDQSLSRSQCVEIESHLAACPTCQSQRDGIAALRDRTTALLAVLTPPISLPPSFDTIRTRARGVSVGRQRVLRRGIWAASVVAALGLGWTANIWLDSNGSKGGASGRDQAVVSRPETAAAQPYSVPDSTRTSPSSSEQPGTVAQREAAPRPGLMTDAPVAAVPRTPVDSTPARIVMAPPAVAAEMRSGDSTRFSSSNTSLLAGDQGLGELSTESMWRIVTIGDAEQESGAPVASVPGLPVVQVKVQGLQPNQRIVAVEQQLPSGEVIRTIEGPAAQMSDMLARDGQRKPGDTASNALDALTAMRFGDRMIVLRGPADSVRALMNRIPVPKKP